MNIYRRKFFEAIDTGESGNLFHASKKALYKNKHDVEEMLPELGPQANRYLELVTSDSYKQMVKKLEYYTGKKAKDFSMPVLMSTIFSALRDIEQVQAGHEHELEKAAVDVVFTLPEFKLFKDLVSRGLIKLDVKLLKADLENAITEQEKQVQQDNELTPDEELNMAVAHELQGGDEGVLKRKFANMVTQGNAVNKFYLFQLAKDVCDGINPKLVNLYGIASALIHATYYSLPHMQLPISAKKSGVGSEEVTPNDDGTYTIVVRSPYFPYLIHELVKGFYDYLSMDVTSELELSRETLDQETMQLMSGPQLYTNLVKLVPQKDLEFLPLIYKLLLSEDINTIKTVLAGGVRAEHIMKGIISKAKQQMSDFDSLQ